MINWEIFAVLVVALLVLDLWVHRGDKAESKRRAIIWSVIWIGAGLAFNLFVWWRMGSLAAQEYLASYAIEKSLSLDNLFVFLIIFRTMRIPKLYQHKALFWGILGAVIFRGIFIFAGAEALQRWHWVEYVFGVILLWAAWKALTENPAEEKESDLVKWLAHRFPVSHRLDHGKFFVFERGRWKLTPLFNCILGLELTDIVFPIDSVPAAFSITRDTFIIYSSNIFAILGLRALYIVLAQTIADMKYLHFGLAAVLAFAAFKLLSSKWIHISPLLSVALIVTMIGAAVVPSIIHARRARARGESPIDPEIEKATQEIL